VHPKLERDLNFKMVHDFAVDHPFLEHGGSAFVSVKSDMEGY
jgi:hypothetical protein